MSAIGKAKKTFFFLALLLCCAAPSAQENKWHSILAEPPPTGGLAQNLSDAYQERAQAARALGDLDRERLELESGIKAVGETMPAAMLMFRLAGNFLDRGNYAKALEVGERLLRVVRANGNKPWEHFVLAAIAVYKAALYDLPGSLSAIREMNVIHGQMRGSPAWSRVGDLLEAEAAWANAAYHKTSGHLADEESGYQACLTAIEKSLGGTMRSDSTQSYFVVDCSTGLMSALRTEGRLAEAGVMALQYRDFVSNFASAAHRPAFFSRVGSEYALVSLDEGKFDEARKVLEEVISRQQKVDAGPSSIHIANALEVMGFMAMVQNNWEQADKLFRKRKDALPAGSVGLDRMTPDWAYTLVRLGRAREAVDGMREVVARQEQIFDESSLVLWQTRAFFAIALAAAGEPDKALEQLMKAVPKVLQLSHGERSSSDSGLARAKRIGWMLDAYIGLLSRAGSSISLGDPVNEAFRMADLARGSTVQRALAAAASRTSGGDRELAGLIRTEQDLQRQMSALSDAIGNLLARGRLSDQDTAVARMRTDLLNMRNTHDTVLKDLQRRFPDYSNLIDPEPPNIDEVRAKLAPDEALLSMYVGADRTIVWNIRTEGSPQVHIATLGDDQIRAAVLKLRKAIEIRDGGVAEYDFGAAYSLYRDLIAPFEASLAGVKHLIVVPHGALGSIPMAMLVTSPFSPSSGVEARFASYRHAPWLVKQMAISQVPTAWSFVALRSHPPVVHPPRPFVGFGDPLFKQGSSLQGSGKSRGLLKRRASGNAYRSGPGESIDLGILPALPDTRQEIGQIAATLGADRSKDVFLGARATESSVKQADLSQYDVVMFATHGLVPGDMPGLYQPALALSNPTLTGEKEDGLLTMEEILNLKLRAEWVVLSACNTASPADPNGEAVSGLGRAFFYAGAKALLVSSWPVETVSARLLTTDVFRREHESAKPLPAAVALQQAALSLMDQGTSTYSYAHPLFWAPFILVGDGG